MAKVFKYPLGRYGLRNGYGFNTIQAGIVRRYSAGPFLTYKQT